MKINHLILMLSAASTSLLIVGCSSLHWENRSKDEISADFYSMIQDNQQPECRTENSDREECRDTDSLTYEEYKKEREKLNPHFSAE